MKKILIVEDDDMIMKNICTLLSLQGYQVFTAANGLEGYEAAISYLPDLIISDIMMPVMDGYQLKKKLEKIPQISSVPFLFLSAKANLEDIRYGMNYGADDYLTKPFRSADLISAIETRFKRVKQLQDANEAAGQAGVSLDYKDKIWIDTSSQHRFLRVRQIKCITAEGVYSNIIAEDGKKYLVRKLIKDWMLILPSEYFVRIHRSTIINLEFVERIEKYGKRAGKVFLTGESSSYDISQRFTRELKSKLRP